MAVASIRSPVYLAVAAPRGQVVPQVQPVPGASPFASGESAGLAIGAAPLAPSARVQLSSLGQVAGAVGALGATLESLAEPLRTGLVAAADAAQLTRTITLLDQSIASLAQMEDPGQDSLDFLASAEFSQRLLAASLGDTVNGRAADGVLGDPTQAALGGLSFDLTRLERALRADPRALVALLGDYARNLDAFFATGATIPDLSGLTGLGAGMAGFNSGSPAGLAGFSSLMTDYGTRQALAAFRANSLL